ncbi:MAG TPA: hypothetical protein VGO65_00690 [Pseudolysinimonas sp.]|nr:hypothetical protein [Pseudolysinimonas sp.]
MPASTTIDFSALTAPMPEAEVKQWKIMAKASGAAWATWQAGNVVAVVFIVPFALIFFGILFGFGGFAFDLASASGNPVTMIVPLLILLGVIAVVAFGIVKGVGSFSRRWELWARMDRFARANGMTFSPVDGDPSYPGAIFQIGDTRQAVDHLRSVDGRFFDLGNYRYTTGSGKNRSTRTWGFLAFNLDRRLPNMMLDSKANNGFFGTNLPATFAKGQILHLEGDFDTFFTLYCPKEYERDALYVFTPDLMALLIDEAAPFDVEIIDDWMFVYSNTGFTTGDPALYARLFRIIDTVGAKTLTQTDRYVDEHVGDFAANVVAPQGARLKRRVSAGAIVVGVFVVILWLSGVLGDAVHALTG